MEIKLNEVHVGQEIKKRLEALHMTKTEFGRQIGVPQQHINRILERETMETKKLVKVCQVLDINIFALFCDFNVTHIDANLAAVGLNCKGGVFNAIGDSALAQQVSIYQEKIRDLDKYIATLEDANKQLKSQLDDKDELIAIYKNRK
jgi:transcriptional regulator with XRE-family HTH domain